MTISMKDHDGVDDGDDDDDAYGNDESDAFDHDDDDDDDAANTSFDCFIRVVVIRRRSLSARRDFMCTSRMRSDGYD